MGSTETNCLPQLPNAATVAILFAGRAEQGSLAVHDSKAKHVTRWSLLLTALPDLQWHITVTQLSCTVTSHPHQFTVFDFWYEFRMLNILLMCLRWGHFHLDYIFKDKFHGAIWAEWSKINFQFPHQLWLSLKINDLDCSYNNWF